MYSSSWWRGARFALFATACALAASAGGSQPAPLPVVPQHLPSGIRDWLNGQRDGLNSRSAAYAAHRTDFLSRCEFVPAAETARFAACETELNTMHGVLAQIRHDKRLFTARVASLTPSCTDPMVVCAAGVVRDGAYLTEQVPALKNSPAADVVSKGFQAVINHDWPVALAWWQTALQRDPGNEAIRLSVDLAQWMVDRGKAVGGGIAPQPPLAEAIRAAARGDYGESIRQFELAKVNRPASAAYIEDMIVVLRQRQAAAEAAYWDQVYKASQKALAEVLRERAMGHVANGERDQAQYWFEEAQDFSPR